MIKFLMKFFRKTDIYSGLNLYSLGRFSYLKLVDAANLIFRFTDRIRLFFYRSRVPIKLHLGCGDQRKDGYLNIDWRKTDATDFVCNISSIPLKDDSVSVIESYHVIEHLSERQAISTLENWYKMLDIGGKLVIECPNFDKAVKEYLDGNTNRIYNIFGYRRFSGDAHQFGYSFDRLREVLSYVGFSDIQNAIPTDYHIHEEPCLRVEAYKNQ